MSGCLVSQFGRTEIRLNVWQVFGFCFPHNARTGLVGSLDKLNSFSCALLFAYTSKLLFVIQNTINCSMNKNEYEKFKAIFKWFFNQIILTLCQWIESMNWIAANGERKLSNIYAYKWLFNWWHYFGRKWIKKKCASIRRKHDSFWFNCHFGTV